MAEEKITARRDFLKDAGKTVTVAGLGCCMLMAESVEVEAGADTIDVDLNLIPEGYGEIVVWKGKPVFVRHRTIEEIKEVRAVNWKSLRDPARDEERVKKQDWLVVMGVCSHYACVPLGSKAGQLKGDFGGWFCACHGSHYDVSGRIRKGVAPKNLAVPKYMFVDEHTIRIG